MATSLKVTGQTTLSELETFVRSAGDGAKIRGRTNRQGEVTLYASTKKSGAFDFVAKLFGGGRDRRRAIGEDAIRTILRNSSSLAPGLHDQLLGNILRDAPRTNHGRELRKDGLRQILEQSQAVLDTTIEFNGRRFTVEKELTQTQSGIVHLFKAQDNGELVVVKRPQPGEDNKRDLLREIEVHTHISGTGPHTHVLRAVGHMTGSRGEPMLLLPFAPNGDAKKLALTLHDLQEQRRIGREDQRSIALTMLQDVGTSLQELHEKAGVLHLDMKLENYLIDEHGHLQLSDFGTSRQGMDGLLEQHPVQSSRNYPPEVSRYVQQRTEGDPALRAEIDRVRAGLDEPGIAGDERSRREERLRQLKQENKQVCERTRIPVDRRSDSWVLGLMAYRLLVDGRNESANPFARDTRFDGDIARKLAQYRTSGAQSFLDFVRAQNPDDEYLTSRIDSLGDEERRLINGLLNADPGERMPVDQALQSEIFQQSWVGSDRIRELMTGLAP